MHSRRLEHREMYGQAHFDRRCLRKKQSSSCAVGSIGLKKSVVGVIRGVAVHRRGCSPATSARHSQARREGDKRGPFCDWRQIWPHLKSKKKRKFGLILNCLSFASCGHVLASTESATSGQSATFSMSQCATGPARESRVCRRQSQMEEKQLAQQILLYYHCPVTQHP